MTRRLCRFVNLTRCSKIRVLRLCENIWRRHTSLTTIKMKKRCRIIRMIWIPKRRWRQVWNHLWKKEKVPKVLEQKVLKHLIINERGGNIKVSTRMQTTQIVAKDNLFWRITQTLCPIKFRSLSYIKITFIYQTAPQKNYP